MSTIFFYWDIKPEKDKEYMDFIFNDYLPSMSRIGISVTDGWLKIAGDGPQIMALGESQDRASALSALETREFRAAETRLLNYVENYSKHLARRDKKIGGR
ncbi:MAG TPA: hypothetical protein VH186_16290 [Chloroflexia bacterium]|nr:hypothetical protein [Chloroflexia bacterium]